MKKLFFFLIPFLLLIVLFRYFNNAGSITGKGLLEMVDDFNFDFKHTVSHFDVVKDKWSEIDFFPYAVKDIGDFFKAIGAFFNAIGDVMEALAKTMGFIFTVLNDLLSSLASIFTVLLNLFGFNGTTSAVLPTPLS